MEIEVGNSALRWLYITLTARAIIVSDSLYDAEVAEWMVVTWVICIRGDLKPTGTYIELLTVRGLQVFVARRGRIVWLQGHPLHWHQK